MFNILISDKLAQQGVDIFKAEQDIQVDVKLGLKPDELRNMIGNYDALVVRSETQVTAEVIAVAKKLKVIGRAGVGFDNIDIPAATRAGIIVMNTPDANTISAAEHTMALILSLARNIPQANASLLAKKWERSKFVGVELLGKTLGIIGLGRIGAEVSSRSKSFGMKIVAYDPYASSDRAKELGVELCDLKTLLSRSDIITVHVPITKDTRQLIGTEELKLCKKGVRIVNVARGGIYDEAAVAEALKSGQVAGAAFDVFSKEPPTDNPLLDLPNFIATPHLGASTEEAQINVGMVVARQIIEALRNGTIFNAVNLPALDAREREHLQPYFTLCDKLAAFLSQGTRDKLDAIHITYSGDVTREKTPALTLAILKDLLASSYQENINYVNAPILAKERGIKVTESMTDHFGSYTNSILIEIESGAARHSIRGTLLIDATPRIVEIDKYRVDVPAEGTLLVFFNPDIPGILGKVSTILGNARVNIAGLANGRIEPGKDAVTVISVDNEVPAEVIKTISAIAGLKHVRLVSLRDQG
ncbi:MAG: phosphoglycerate dehydrogenase [Bacteroidota bacterium]|nr:phosphoglycerate dehydrogenase [Bacteroidota bacterium]MDP4231536.1 phosphoglycerate dehydrogenase [Bacteroidota bacterium]